ncbi:MAG: hypothetical protein OHK0029_41310 [Armatimonadaceae bacterium]
MFVRFITTTRVNSRGNPQGLFVAAQHLKETGELEKEEAEYLAELLQWFCLHLPVPSAEEIDSRAIFWFKSASAEHIRRMWEIAHILEKHGYFVEMIKQPFVGRVIYSDAHQVAGIWKMDHHI